jgi:hypothetical protein
MRFFYKKLDDDGAIVKNLLSKWTPVFEPLKKQNKMLLKYKVPLLSLKTRSQQFFATHKEE